MNCIPRNTWRQKILPNLGLVVFFCPFQKKMTSKKKRPRAKIFCLQWFFVDHVGMQGMLRNSMAKIKLVLLRSIAPMYPIYPAHFPKHVPYIHLHPESPTFFHLWCTFLDVVWSAHAFWENSVVTPVLISSLSLLSVPTCTPSQHGLHCPHSWMQGGLKQTGKMLFEVPSVVGKQCVSTHDTLASGWSQKSSSKLLSEPANGRIGKSSW